MSHVRPTASSPNWNISFCSPLPEHKMFHFKHLCRSVLFPHFFCQCLPHMSRMLPSALLCSRYDYILVCDKARHENGWQSQIKICIIWWNVQECRLLLASGHVHRTKKGKIAAKLQAVKKQPFLTCLHPLEHIFQTSPWGFFILVLLQSRRSSCSEKCEQNNHNGRRADINASRSSTGRSLWGTLMSRGDD